MKGSGRFQRRDEAGSGWNGGRSWRRVCKKRDVGGGSMRGKGEGKERAFYFMAE
jgi:hypothetical protein